VPEQNLVLIRGGGDLASAVAHRLYRSGFKLILAETFQPTMVRRTVSFGEAVYRGSQVVEGVTARKAADFGEAKEIIIRGEIPVLVDPGLRFLSDLAPRVLIDAIIAKKNLGTSLKLAPLVIGLGPGFQAGGDVHAVIETQRGHYLGRVIWQGEALPNTGVPGDIGGYTSQRVLRAPVRGVWEPLKEIGSAVRAGEPVGFVSGQPVISGIDGILRGCLYPRLEVEEQDKLGDVDPRGNLDYCFTISDKGRAVAGGVLEAILGFFNRKE